MESSHFFTMFSRCAPSLSNTVLDYVILVPFLSRRYIYQLPKRLRGSADERSTSRSGRGVARSRARQVGSDGLREVVIAQWMPDTAEFCLAFRGMMPAQILTTGEVFSPLAQSRLLTGQGPTPTSVGIHYGPSERTAPVFFGSNGAGGSRGSGE
jgi:hypothetical protein